MGIKINSYLFNVLNHILKNVDLKDKLNVEYMAFYLRSIKEPEAATWVENNPTTYKAGVLAGFEVDNENEGKLWKKYISKLK